MSIEQQPIENSRIRLYSKARSGEVYVTQDINGGYFLHGPKSAEMDRPLDARGAEMSVVRGDLERIDKDFESQEAMKEYINSEAEKWFPYHEHNYLEEPFTRGHIEAILGAMADEQFQERYGEKIRELAEKLLREEPVVTENEDLREKLTKFIS